jgi:hypothetical protein
MRSILVIGLVACGLVGFGGIANAEEGGRVRFGGGIALAFEGSDVGLQGKAFIPVPLVEISPSVTWYPDPEFVHLDADGHLALPIRSKAVFNGFAGLNLALGNDEEELGLNLGIAARLGLGETLLGYGEFKYIVSDFDTFVLSAGILF